MIILASESPRRKELIKKIVIEFGDGFFKRPQMSGTIILTSEYAKCLTSTLYDGGNISQTSEKIEAINNRYVKRAFDSMLLLLNRKFYKTSVKDASGFSITFTDLKKHKQELFFDFSFKDNRIAMQGNALMKLFEFTICRADVFHGLKRTIIKPRKPRKPDLSKITNDGVIKDFRIGIYGGVYRKNGYIPESFNFKTKQWHPSDAAAEQFYEGWESYKATPEEVYEEIKKTLLANKVAKK